MVNKESSPDRELYRPHEYAHQISGTVVCKRCHCVHADTRWVVDDSLFRRLLQQPGVPQILCPACRAVEGQTLEGVVIIRGQAVDLHRSELLNLIRNEERRALGKNPLARIARIVESADQVEVQTTTEVLAVRIGRSIERAHHGSASNHWLPGEKFVRITVDC